MTPRKRRSISLLVGAIVFIAPAAGFFLPDPIPEIVLWVPGHLADYTAREILHKPGTHGLGYFYPGLTLNFFLGFYGLVAVISGLVASRVLRSRAESK